MKSKMMVAGACMAFALATQANTVTFTFQENGPGTLGASSTFTESGISLTATAQAGQTLYAKNQGGDETGLGLTDEEDHEIDGSHFLQLTVPTSPVTSLKLIFLGSVQSGELAKIYFSSTLGTLGSQIGTVSSDGSFDISALGPGYIGITGGGTGGANVLLNSLTVETVPDCGSTVALLGAGLTCIGMLRRKLVV
jgi:hypothetical protein